ncbi:MAG: AEC family transporter [Pseudomonadota bacterium]
MTDFFEVFGAVGGVLLPVLIISAAGYVWAKRDPRFTGEFIGDVALHVGVPGLLFASLVRAEIDTALLGIAACGAVGYIAFVHLALLAVFKATGTASQPGFTGLAFGNWGNIGMPISLFAFGATGLSIGATFFATSIFLQFTLGYRLSVGAWPWRKILTLPLLWLLAAAVLVRTLNLVPPKWVLDTADLAGGAAIPAMLLALGGGVARMHPKGLLNGLKWASLRYVIGLVASLALIALLPLPDALKPVILTIGMMPLALFNYIMAEKTGEHGPEVAGYVVASLLIACVVLPVTLMFTLR